MNVLFWGPRRSGEVKTLGNIVTPSILCRLLAFDVIQGLAIDGNCMLRPLTSDLEGVLDWLSSPYNEDIDQWAADYTLKRSPYSWTLDGGGFLCNARKFIKTAHVIHNCPVETHGTCPSGTLYKWVVPSSGCAQNFPRKKTTKQLFHSQRQAFFSFSLLPLCMPAQHVLCL